MVAALNTLRHADAARTLRNDTPDVGSKPHFIEHVVRVDVRADAHVDAAPHIAPEVAQRDAAPREYGWAMRDRRTAARQRPEIIGLRPVRPGVMIEKDAVTDDRARREDAKRVQPFDRGLAVPADDFVKLRQRLRGMGLIGQGAPGRFAERVAKKALGAGVDLCGADHAREASSGIGLRFVDLSQRRLESLIAASFVKIVFHDEAVAREPAARPEHRRDADPQARARKNVEPAFGRQREVAEGRDARQQDFGKRDAIRRLHAFLVRVQNGQILIERGVVEFVASDLIPHALVHRLAERMRVNVDQTGHHETSSRRP